MELLLSSYRQDIIQKYISNDNITVMKVMVERLSFDKVDESALEEVVVIITHLFGLDFDLSC